MTANNEDVLLAQLATCRHFDAPFIASPDDQKIGLADNAFSGLMPLNGLRHIPVNGTTGWYVWAGEDFPVGEDAFKPLHVEHLKEDCPSILKYLGLPPGWRFLIADGCEDLWYDHTLLVE